MRNKLDAHSKTSLASCYNSNWLAHHIQTKDLARLACLLPVQPANNMLEKSSVARPASYILRCKSLMICFSFSSSGPSDMFSDFQTR